MDKTSRNISYLAVLSQYPQIRSISRIYYSRDWSAKEKQDIDSLQMILRHPEANLFISIKEINRILNFFRLKTARFKEISAKDIKQQDNNKDNRTYPKISGIYNSVY